MDPLKSSDGALFVYPQGPGMPGYYMGCVDADTIEEPQGAEEIIRCFDVNGLYKTVGTKKAPPDPVTTTLTQLSYVTRTLLEKLRGDRFGLIFLQRSGGRADSFDNWLRARILPSVGVISKSYDNILKREEEEPTTQAFELSSTPPLITCERLYGRRIYETGTTEFTCMASIVTNPGAFQPVNLLIAAAKCVVGSKAQCYYSKDGGVSWTDFGEPFAINEEISACCIVDMGVGRSVYVGRLEHTYRCIFFKKATGAAVQGQSAWWEFALSTMGGAAYVANIGGAAAGQGATTAEAVWAQDNRHIWVAGPAGNIWFSSDAGNSWVAQTTAGVSNFNAISFDQDGLFGVAFGVGSPWATYDGGATWAGFNYWDNSCGFVGPVPTTPWMTCCVVGKNDVFATDSLHHIYTNLNSHPCYRNVPWPGDQNVSSFKRANDYVFFLSDVAGAVFESIDGGYSWFEISVDYRALHLAIIDHNLGYYAGTNGTYNACEVGLLDVLSV